MNQWLGLRRIVLAQSARTVLASTLATAAGCSSAVRHDVPTLRMPDRPIAFVGSLREVTIVVRRNDSVPQCSRDDHDGRIDPPKNSVLQMSNSCGCELTTFAVSRWLIPPVVVSPVVQLSSFASEWCRPTPEMGSSLQLVAWDSDHGGPDFVPLYELRPGKWFFAPDGSMTLLGVPLEPLMVDEPIPGAIQTADPPTNEEVAELKHRGGCERDGVYLQCRSVPLESFVDALKRSPR